MTDREEMPEDAATPRSMIPPSNRAQWLSAIAASASAIAALATVWVAHSAWKTNQQGQRRQLQPYVSVLSATVVQRSNAPPAVRVIFENGGVTPALNLAVECYTAVAESDSISDEYFPKQGSLQPATGTLAPHHQGSCLVGLSGMPGWRMSDLSEGRLVAGVRTYISFDDEFGQKHRLVFTASAGGQTGLAEDGRMSVVGSNESYTER